MIFNNQPWTALSLCSLISIALPAHALNIEGFDLLDIYTSATLQYDDNLFRLAQTPTAPATGVNSRSDRIASGRIGMGLDKSYGLQRWKLDANVSRYRYARNSFLNYTGTNYNALWQWQFTPSVSGNLSYDRNQQPVNFADYTNYSQKNIRTNDNRRFDLDWTVSGGWHAIAAVSRINQENGTLFTTEASYSQRGAEAGLKYQFPSGSTLSLSGRDAEGKYLDRALNPVALLDTQFNQKEIETRLNWLLSSKTTVNARLSYLMRAHENYTQRDYSGLVGNIDYNWNITGKILLNGRVERGLNTYQDIDSSYYVNQQVSLSPVWLMTDKINARLMLSSAVQKYRGSIRPVASPDRRDRLNNYQFSINWNPTEEISLTGSMQHQERNSPSLPTREYTDQITGVNAQIRF